MTYKAHHTAIIDSGAVIGDETHIWHWTHICGHAKIGARCRLGQNVFIANHVTIGDDVKVQNNVSIYEPTILEDGVFCGPSVVFTNVINPRSLVNRKAEFRLTHIQKGASLGANSTIICGICIGAYAFIGAGAVVTKSVPDYALMMGNPARQQGWMSQQGCRLEFDASGHADCVESGKRYRLYNDSVTVLS